MWSHEALNFTPWVAENVDLLADAVGLDITVDETESSVGDFNVDIYASETGTDRKIIIENQLEDTDHDHLGKLITYASGKAIADMEKYLDEKHGRVQIRQLSDGSYEMDGQTPLEDIEEKLDIKFDCEDIDTINGYLIYKLGKIPDENEEFETECGGYIFRILSVGNKMIQKVLVSKADKKDKGNEAG